MWKEVGNACGWKHPKAPSARNMFEGGRATEAVLAFLRDTDVECMVQTRAGGSPRERGRRVLVHPRMCSLYISPPPPLCSFLYSHTFGGSWRMEEGVGGNYDIRTRWRRLEWGLVINHAKDHCCRGHWGYILQRSNHCALTSDNVR